MTDANLTNVDFMDAVLANADLARSDMRGAFNLSSGILFRQNAILEDGRINGLDLANGETLRFRDYDGGIAITIDNEMMLDPGAVLDVIFADAEWGSTISLTEGILTDLDGTLFLASRTTSTSTACSVRHSTCSTERRPGSGDAFAEVTWPAGVDWDISDLYLGGTVTLTGVPEPTTLMLVLMGLLALRRR